MKHNVLNNINPGNLVAIKPNAFFIKSSIKETELYCMVPDKYDDNFRKHHNKNHYIGMIIKNDDLENYYLVLVKEKIFWIKGSQLKILSSTTTGSHACAEI